VAGSGVHHSRSRPVPQHQSCADGCVKRRPEHSLSGLESSMSKVQVEQKIYEMPPREGFTVAHFLTVADIDRSARFCETIFGGPF
jgi:hypothetical protein